MVLLLWVIEFFCLFFHLGLIGDMVPFGADTSFGAQAEARIFEDLVFFFQLVSIGDMVPCGESTSVGGSAVAPCIF